MSQQRQQPPAVVAHKVLFGGTIYSENGFAEAVDAITETSIVIMNAYTGLEREMHVVSTDWRSDTLAIIGGFGVGRIRMVCRSQKLMDFTVFDLAWENMVFDEVNSRIINKALQTAMLQASVTRREVALENMRPQRDGPNSHLDIDSLSQLLPYAGPSEMDRHAQRLIDANQRVSNEIRNNYRPSERSQTQLSQRPLQDDDDPDGFPAPAPPAPRPARTSIGPSVTQPITQYVQPPVPTHIRRVPLSASQQNPNDDEDYEPEDPWTMHASQRHNMRE